MEPKQPAPNIGPEYSAPSYVRTPESNPSWPSFEAGIEREAEQLGQRSETIAKTAPPYILPAPVVLSQSSHGSDDDAIATDDTPLVANDDDLIEREWVDKAKKIILQTKDDPYRREQEVGKLQADYLLKRYGKELGPTATGG